MKEWQGLAEVVVGVGIGIWSWRTLFRQYAPAAVIGTKSNL